jgi:hypothetical protein
MASSLNVTMVVIGVLPTLRSRDIDAGNGLLLGLSRLVSGIPERDSGPAEVVQRNAQKWVQTCLNLSQFERFQAARKVAKVAGNSHYRPLRSQCWGWEFK